MERTVYGRRPVLELLRAGETIEQILVAQNSAPSHVLAEIDRRARAAAVKVRRVPRSEVERLAPGASHQGIVAIAASYSYADLTELLARPAPAVLFLDGITDPHNLGSLLRSAEGAGFDGIVIPARRSAAVTATVVRVAAGAADLVPVARVVNLGRALDAARDAGLWLVGLDAAGAEDLWSSDLMTRPVALVIGSEDKGMSQSIRSRCDALVRIPLAGKIESLNAGVAGGLAMFEIARRAAPPADPAGTPD